ncbi:hypothetical protein LX73_1196 [Fodinibius salinus]|uniref:Tetratricopeptide repeat-containing protein n=1 Tax=Fodinibius salinus TaxID=860790 RepID=A0A5D3YIV2_9BACT|nr:hypothetical protein [Fodinibius salinus]TYP93492.1 hypothetical protein LX73_1196 [Fodinibius salinus]
MKKLLLFLFLIFSSSSLMAQNATSPPDGMSEVGAYSLFLENYKSDSFEKAVKFGRWIWEGMPESIEGYSRFELKRNLRRLANSYSGYAEELEDPAMQEAYADTALQIYDQMFKKYSDKSNHYSWYINRGRLYQTHSNVFDNASAKASENYYKAFELRPEEFTNYGDGYYIQVMLQEMIAQGKKDKALSVMKKAEPYASEKLKTTFNDKRNQLFESPGERITFLEGRLKENPKNQKVLSSLRDLYREQEMTKKERSVAEKLYKLNPSYGNTMALADFAVSNANHNMAIKYFNEAMDKAQSDKQKAEISIKISDAYLNSGRLRKAREYARSATDYDSDWGAPYIQIADIYARAVSKCAEGRKMERRDKTVYWLVLDYLDKAKRIDPNTTNEVERKYKSYSPVTPTNEEKFFWDPPLNSGDEFKIDGSLMECYEWINETTTVR